MSVERDARTALLKRTVRRTLAAVARRALTSALDNIGARLADSAPTSNALVLSGRNVTPATGNARDDALRNPAGACAPETHGRDAGACAPVAESLASDGEALLSTSGFSLSPDADGGGPLWAVWGRGRSRDLLGPAPSRGCATRASCARAGSA